MGREATKAADSVYYQARKAAASYNDKLSSREGAAELLGMSASAVTDAELGLNKCMPVDTVVRMADLYHAPQLLSHYCVNECPIGKRQWISDRVYDLPLISVKLLNALKSSSLKKIKDTILDIAEDGRITDDELEDADSVVRYLNTLSKVICEAKIMFEMTTEGGKLNG